MLFYLILAIDAARKNLEAEQVSSTRLQNLTAPEEGFARQVESSAPSHSSAENTRTQNPFTDPDVPSLSTSKPAPTPTPTPASSAQATGTLSKQGRGSKQAYVQDEEAELGMVSGVDGWTPLGGAGSFEVGDSEGDDKEEAERRKDSKNTTSQMEMG